MQVLPVTHLCILQRRQRMHVKDVLVGLQVHGSHVGGEGLLGKVPQLWICRHLRRDLRLGAHRTLLVHLDLLGGHLGFVQLLQHAGNLVGQQHQQAVALVAVPRCAANAVDVALCVVRAVELQHLWSGNRMGIGVSECTPTAACAVTRTQSTEGKCKPRAATSVANNTADFFSS